MIEAIFLHVTIGAACLCFGMAAGIGLCQRLQFPRTRFTDVIEVTEAGDLVLIRTLGRAERG